jgi:hypothetical protein
MIEATQILAEQAEMEDRRSNFDTLWDEVAGLMLPRQAEFLTSTSTGGFNQGRPRTDKIFEETAMLGLDHGCAVFEGEVIPQGGQWQRLVARDPDLMKKRHVAVWFELLGNRLFALRNSPYSGFANQTHESVASLLSFGFQGTTTEKLIDERGHPCGLRYKSEHIGQLFIREDAGGMIETTHRKFELTHRQALMKWGDQAPEIALKAREDPSGAKLSERACYIHRLSPMPRALYDPDRIDFLGKPIASFYLSVNDKQMFNTGGFRKRPLTCSRYEKSPMEDYGRSPAINVLPAIRAAQQIKPDLVTAIEFMARPALGAHDDMLDQLLMYAPNGVSFGAIDDRGNALIKRLWDDPDISPGLQLLADTQSVIKRAFFEDLYIVRQDVKTHVSASEQILRDQQRGILLAPLKRQETEWFTPQTERELDLMAEMGMLDDMPQEVREAGGLYQVVYDNPLANARKAGAAGAFYNMLQGVTPLMQLDPENTPKQFFQKFPFARVLDGLADIHGVPASFGASEEEMAQSTGRCAGAGRQGELARGWHGRFGDRQEFRRRRRRRRPQQEVPVPDDGAQRVARESSSVANQRAAPLTGC